MLPQVWPWLCFSLKLEAAVRNARWVDRSTYVAACGSFFLAAFCHLRKMQFLMSFFGFFKWRAVWLESCSLSPVCLTIAHLGWWNQATWELLVGSRGRCSGRLEGGSSEAFSGPVDSASYIQHFSSLWRFSWRHCWAVQICLDPFHCSSQPDLGASMAWVSLVNDLCWESNRKVHPSWFSWTFRYCSIASANVW